MNTHTTPIKEPIRNLFEPPVDWTWHQTATVCSEERAFSAWIGDLVRD